MSWEDFRSVRKGPVSGVEPAVGVKGWRRVVLD